MINITNHDDKDKENIILTEELTEARKENSYLQRQVKLQQQIIQEQKISLERAHSRTAKNKAKDSSQTHASKETEQQIQLRVEEEIEKRIADRIKKEKTKWELAHTISLAQQHTQSPTSQQQQQQAHQEENKITITKQNHNDLIQNEEIAMVPLDATLTTDELKLSAPAEESRKKELGKKEDVELVSALALMNDLKLKDNHTSTAALSSPSVTLDTSLSTITSSSTGTTNIVNFNPQSAVFAVAVLNLRRELKILKDSYRKTRQELIMLKAGVSEIDITASDIVEEIETFKLQKRDLQLKLEHVMRYLKQV